MVGLGKAALAKGYKRVMVIAEDYAFPYSQVQGFMAEYCTARRQGAGEGLGAAGRQGLFVGDRRIPKDVDALLVVLGGADAVNFLNQYEAAGGDKPMLGGSITVSQDVLNYRGKRRDSLVGTLVGRPAAPTPTTAPTGRPSSPTTRRTSGVGRRLSRARPCSRYVYYVNMKAALDGLEAVKGDLSGGQAKYREALSKMMLKTPNGDVKLDANRQAIGTTFVTEVVKDAQGQPVQQGRTARSTTSSRCWA